MRFAVGLMVALLMVTGCSKPSPPVGKWEGGYESGGDLVVARVEILPSGQVKIMAPDITNAIGSRQQMDEFRARLTADLANGWSEVAPRSFDFDGKTFRKPGGVAPQMVWDKASNHLTLELYIGARPALPVPLRPVDDFHDNPFASG
ncbi:MAG TPA: hypothetical protein VEM35_05540 [Rhizomicrobium sp.]|nr:hypothetical protein [Rhizomicrobium sp.]